MFLDNAIRQLIVHDSVGGNERLVCLSVVVPCMRCNCPSQKPQQTRCQLFNGVKDIIFELCTCRKYNRSSRKTG